MALVPSPPPPPPPRFPRLSSMSPVTLPARASLSPPLASSPPVFSFRCHPPPQERQYHPPSAVPVWRPGVMRPMCPFQCPDVLVCPPPLTCAAGGTCFGCGGRAEETAPPGISLISLTQLQASSGEWVSFGLRSRRSLPPSLWVPCPVLLPSILSLALVVLASWCLSLCCPPHPPSLSPS